MKKKNNFLILVCFGFSILFYGQESNTNLVDLKKQLLQEKSDTARVSITSKIAKLYVKSKPDSAFYYYNQALDLATKIESKLQSAEILYQTANAYSTINFHKKAIEYYLKAAPIFQKINKNEKVASVYLNLGYSYLYFYAEDKAIKYYLKSLNIYKELNNEVGVASNYIAFGNLYYDQENYTSAEKYHTYALKIFEKLDDKEGISICYVNLGNTISDGGDIEAGLEYYNKALKLDEEKDDQYGTSLIYNNIGDCYLIKKQYYKALDYFNKSLDILTILNDKELMPLVLLNVSDVHNKLKNYSISIKNAEKSLKIAKENRIIEYELDNLNNLITAYEGLGNKTEALKYYRLYKKVNDSLQKKDKTKIVNLFNTLSELERNQYTINELSIKNELTQVKYESGRKFSYFLVGAMVLFGVFIILLIIQRSSKKEAYNLLEYKNTQIKKMHDKIQTQRDDLKQLNKTKDQFFSIIAHDLKNPFNSINGFTELMIENNHEYNEEKRLKFLNIIKGATSNVTNLLNNLLTWANSQSGNLVYNPEEVQLIQEISSVISLLEIQAINKEIEIINKIDNTIFVIADKNMLATILRNLISNAIKFTKAKGEIKMSSKITPNFVEITVKDNGIGISQTDIENLFSIEVKNSNIGTSNEQGSGLGLILCKEFVEKHSGKIWVKSTVGKGSEFKFTLPKSN